MVKWEGKRRKMVHVLWRGVELKKQRWSGTGLSEWPEQDHGDRAALMGRTMSGSLIPPQLESVLIAVKASATTKGYMNQAL